MGSSLAVPCTFQSGNRLGNKGPNSILIKVSFSWSLSLKCALRESGCIGHHGLSSTLPLKKKKEKKELASKHWDSLTLCLSVHGQEKART